MAEEEEGEGEGEGVYDSRWGRQGGWLRHNPLGVPTEREFYVQQQGLPVFRMLLVKKGGGGDESLSM